MFNKPKNTGSELPEAGPKQMDDGNNLRELIHGRIRGAIQEYSYRFQMAACETPDDFRALFGLHGLTGDAWRNTETLRINVLTTLGNAISRRFGGWNKFLEFMGPETIIVDASILRRPYSVQVAACKTPDDFRTLFNLHRLTENVWKSSKRLEINDLTTLQRLISKRFGGWDKFLEFMGPETILERSYPGQVAACKTRDDFRTLFNLHRLTENVWRSSSKLQANSSKNLQLQISKRFGDWDKFLEFMGPEKIIVDKSILRRPYSVQVAACKTRDDFRTLFDLHEVKHDAWRNTGTLSRIGLAAVANAICKRFGWDQFLSWMDGREDELIGPDISMTVQQTGTPDDI